MRYKILILAAVILGSLFSTVAASGGCGKWVARAPSYDFLQDPIMDMSDPLPNETSPEAFRVQTANTNVSSQLAAARVSAAPKLDLSGKWSFRLNGTNNASSDVILIQSASWAEDGIDRIQGYGNLLENDLITPLTATGSLSNDTLDLELKPSATSGKIKSNKRYVLQMALSQDRFG